MPGAAEFQPAAPTGRSPRASVSSEHPYLTNRRAGPDVTSQTALTTVTSQPVLTSQPAAGDALAVVEPMEAAGAGYCMLTTSLPAPTSQPSMMAVGSSPGPGQGGGGGVVYWMPVVTVPYANNMGQVNLAWAPSQDPCGKDLPLTDMNTLRYFFNLGVEYFRISANMQQQQPQQQAAPQSYYTSSPLPQLVPSGGPASSMLVPLEQGASFATPTTPAPHRHKGATHTPHNTPTGKPPPPVPRSKTPARGTTTTTATAAAAATSTNSNGGGGQEGPSKAESMELSSDLSDSGCTSCGEGGQGGDDDVELASNRTDEDSGSTQGEDGGADKGLKGKGKRKYYMYGSHKLIKPIKDIPPRFQLMLAENSAAKARCEGQPIYMQLSPADLLVLEQGETCSGLNADAQCFYPTQAFDAVLVDDSGMATFSSARAASSHPPPMMVPPPPLMQAAGGPAVSVVYSSLPSSSASALPPPAYARPVSVATGDGKLLPVVAAGGGGGGSGSGASAGKGPAAPGPDKRSEELAGPSPGKVVELVTSPRVSVPPPPSVNGPPPFPAPTSMPPPLSAPPLHASTGPGGGGGGKQCFYMYPSHSAGYPSMPATPPQGQSHAPGLSQGQVVYVMNPQGYGAAPPCTAYQPTLMAPPSMGVPCAPVAVQ